MKASFYNVLGLEVDLNSVVGVGPVISNGFFILTAGSEYFFDRYENPDTDLKDHRDKLVEAWKQYKIGREK